jgi:putative ABC transport system permease protein
MVMKQGLTLAGVGLAAGLAASLALTRMMQSLLYQVRPNDPETFVVVALALMGVAVLASAVPAYRATRVSPLIALRTE